jgi:hypothetical protein
MLGHPAVEGRTSDDSRGPRGTGRGLLVNLGLALAAVAVTLGALEIALRVLDVRTASYHAIAGFTVHDPVLGWKLAPSRETLFRGAHFAVQVSQNAEGLRDRHYPYDREPGRRRILVLGDSVVWCWGVEQSDCFTERLEAARPDTDVVNAGVPGYSTAQEISSSSRRGSATGPTWCSSSSSRTTSRTTSTSAVPVSASTTADSSRRTCRSGVARTSSASGCRGTRACSRTGSRYYASTLIDTARGERWFCSEAEARAASRATPASATTRIATRRPTSRC